MEFILRVDELRVVICRNEEVNAPFIDAIWSNESAVHLDGSQHLRMLCYLHQGNVYRLAQLGLIIFSVVNSIRVLQYFLRF